MERKEILKTINQKLSQGLTKQEIFKELLSQVKFKSDLVRYIAMIPSYEARKKYKILNMILFSILIYIAISKLIIGVVLLSQISIYALPVALLFPLVRNSFH